MPRREREPKQPFDEAAGKARKYVDGPLDAIGRKLSEFLSQSQASFAAGCLHSDSFRDLCIEVGHLAERLPTSFGDRFTFDSALIQAIGEDWGSEVGLSRMVIPRHSSDWGHERIFMPSEKADSHSECGDPVT